MITTDPNPVPGTDGPPSQRRLRPATRDLRGFWRRATALSIVLGPLCVLMLRWLMPYWTDQDQASAVAEVAGALDRTALTNWISVLSYPFLLLGALGIGHAVRRSTPVLATVGTALLFGGLTLGSTLGASDLLTESMLRAGHDQALVTEVTTQFMEHPAGFVGLLAFVVGHLSGFVVLAVAVVRSRLVPLWVGMVLALAQPVHVVSAVLVPSRALDVVGGWGATVLACAVVALAVLRMPDEEWDAPPVGVRG